MKIYLNRFHIINIVHAVRCGQYMSYRNQSSATVIFYIRSIIWIGHVSQCHHVRELPESCTFSVENIGINLFAVFANDLVLILATSCGQILHFYYLSEMGI